MTKIPGKNADLWIDGISTETDGNVMTLTITPDVLEVAELRNSAKEYAEGKYDWGLDFQGFWNSATNANDFIFNHMLGRSNIELKCYPGGSPGVYYLGTALLTNYSIESLVDGPVTCNAKLKGSGCLTRKVIPIGGYPEYPWYWS